MLITDLGEYPSWILQLLSNIQSNLGEGLFPMGVQKYCANPPSSLEESMIFQRTEHTPYAATVN